MPLVGIDLGTTNSLISCWSEDGALLIPNAFGEYLTPSVVSFNENNEVYVGKVAKEMLVTNPQNTYCEFKRDMGTNKTYEVECHNKKYTPEELSAFVLRQLKEDAEAYLGEKVEEAVISVPAYFNDKQRCATRVAGQLAGLKVERLINEPSSAAMAYRMNKTGEHMLSLIFDFGGGTLDVSLVDSFENVVEILGVAGDNHLGGKDFNEAIAAYFYKENALDKDKLTDEMKAIVYHQAENAKILLTIQDEVNSSILLDGIEYKLCISNTILKKISFEIFKRIIETVQKVLTISEVTIEDLDKVILVGGSSKMPLVVEFLKSIFGKKVENEQNPEEIVAIGAGIVAGIKMRDSNIKDMLLSDICPFTLGTELYNGKFAPIIERNEILPCSKSSYYTTVYDNQKFIEFKIFQGDQLIARDNLLITTLSINVPERKAGEVRVNVNFSYDLNGIFAVDVQCIDNGERVQQIIINENSGMSEKEIQEHLNELEQLKLKPRSEAETNFLIGKANRLYKESNPRMRNMISDAVNEYEHVQKNEINAQIRREAYVKFLCLLEIVEKSNMKLDTSSFFADDSLE